MDFAVSAPKPLAVTAAAFLFQPFRSSRPHSALPRDRCHLLPHCSVALPNHALSRSPILASVAARSGGYGPVRAASDHGANVEDVGGGGGEGYGSGGGEGYGSGGGNGGGDRKEWGGLPSQGGEGKKMGGGMPLSQKITLGYATLVGVGGLMGYLKGGSQKSLGVGGLSALLLYFVYTQLPVRPAFASSLGLGLSATLLAVMGSRFRKSGKIFPAGVISLVSFVMVGGYAHGILRGLHG